MTHIERAAFDLLRDRLGLVVATKAQWSLIAGGRRGEPFDQLPPPRDDGEAESRAYAGAAIRLIHELEGMVEVDEPLAWAAEAIEEGMLAWLSERIGPFSPRDLMDRAPDERAAFLEERGRRFPNAAVCWMHAGVREVRFVVTACRLVALCHEAGEARLASFFCRGEARFLGGVAPRVVLIRDRTIAAGAPDCPFTVQFRAPETAAPAPLGPE